MNKLFEKSSKLRNLRQQVVGIDKIKDDPFANDRLELEEYEAVVRSTKGAVENFNKALEGLNGVHADMMASLRKFHEFNENIVQRKRIDTLGGAVDAFDEEFMKSRDNMDVVIHKLDSLLAMHAGLATRLTERDKAHAAKAHYESKLNTLQSNEKDPEKVQRNLKKQQEAQTEFDKTEELTIRECRDALNTRWKDMDQVLGIYVRELSKYFSGINERFAPLGLASEEMITSHVKDDRVEALQSPKPENSPSLPTSSFRSISAHDAEADADHSALRSALGLRLKGKGPKVEETKAIDSDNESDLMTPPSMKGR
jgi:hypothetical protein